MICHAGCKKTLHNEEGFFYKQSFEKQIYTSSKPMTRWWWFADIIHKEDIVFQINQFKEHGFGGVEIAWVYPLTRNRFKKETDTVFTKRFRWLGKEWQEMVSFTKKYCDSIDFQCDFTFGTGWPFGDSYVEQSHATQVFNPEDNRYQLTYNVTWEHPKKGFILNHLDKQAFLSYANRMGTALEHALEGSSSCLFCDSWEVPTRKIWTEGFEDAFIKRYAYDIKDYMDNIYDEQYANEHYDYTKLVSELVINNFYSVFTQWAHQHNSYTRSQCSGAPVDLITAYATQDIPESEAMLYEPDYSKIALSAAAYTGKSIISAETFTCTYGFPELDSVGKPDYKYIKEEQVADLKLVSDALFANGVNQIIWHGAPYNTRSIDTNWFYATVHVGTEGNLWKEIKPFNQYMEKVSSFLRQGIVYSNVAVYIPQEDAWMAQEMNQPNPLMPWAWGEYEMRSAKMPEELRGFHPLWVNGFYLEKAKVVNKKIHIGAQVFDALYLDVKYLDYKSLLQTHRIAKNQGCVVLKNRPIEPGHNKHHDFEELVNEILMLDNVVKDIDKKVKPIISGENLPDFIVKKKNNHFLFFFANPDAKDLSLPLKYGQSFRETAKKIPVTFEINGESLHYELVFDPYQSIMIEITEDLKIEEIDIKFYPDVPKQE